MVFNESVIKELKKKRRIHKIRLNTSLKRARQETNPERKKQHLEDARYHQIEFMKNEDRLKEIEKK